MIKKLTTLFGCLVTFVCMNSVLACSHCDAYYTPQKDNRYYSHPLDRGYYKQNRVKPKRKYRPRYTYSKDFLPKRLYVGTVTGYFAPLGFEMSPGEIKHDSGGAVYGIQAGAEFNEWLKVGLEITHLAQHQLKETSDAGTVTAKTSQNTVMVNSYLSMPHMSVTPYFLVGVGLSWNNLSHYINNNTSIYGNNTTTNFAYQIGGGLSLPYRNLDIYGEIKYANRGKIKTKSGNKPDNGVLPPRKAQIEGLIFAMGVRYNFNYLQMR